MIDVRVPEEQEGTRATVRAWLKQVGDKIAENDPLVELETDKVTQEVPAPAAAVLAEIVLETDSEALPGALLARISTAAVQPSTARYEPAEGPPFPPAPQEQEQVFDKLSPAAGVESRLSPSVRRALQQHAIDPARIEGTGHGGRITRDDVDRAIASASVQARRLGPGDIPHDRMRLTIAENMVRAVAEQPHVTAVF